MESGRERVGRRGGEGVGEARVGAEQRKRSKVLRGITDSSKFESLLEESELAAGTVVPEGKQPSQCFFWNLQF